MDEVPHDEGLLGEPLVGEKALRVGGELEAGDLGCRRHHPTKARGLAVGEDRAPGERRDRPHRDGLGEQHGRVGVVSAGEVDEADRHEQRVRVAVAFELADELGPDDLDDHGLEAAVGAAVLGVHREQDKVAEPVGAQALGVEGDQGIEEVGDAESALDPGTKVDDERREVVGVGRELGGEVLDAADDPVDELARSRVLGGIRDAAVGDLELAEFGDGALEG